MTGGPGFLPPEPPGPEPELGGRPARLEVEGPRAEEPRAWAAPAPAPAPDNGQAVAGFVLSIVALGLLVLSAGLSTLLSLGLAIAGVVFSRRGRERVDRGETPKHRGLAQAGFVVGWITIGLALLATVVWIALLVVALTSGDSSFDWETVRAARGPLRA